MGLVQKIASSADERSSLLEEAARVCERQAELYADYARREDENIAHAPTGAKRVIAREWGRLYRRDSQVCRLNAQAIRELAERIELRRAGRRLDRGDVAVLQSSPKEHYRERKSALPSRGKRPIVAEEQITVSDVKVKRL